MRYTGIQNCGRKFDNANFFYCIGYSTSSGSFHHFGTGKYPCDRHRNFQVSTSGWVLPGRVHHDVSSIGKFQLVRMSAWKYFPTRIIHNELNFWWVVLLLVRQFPVDCTNQNWKHLRRIFLSNKLEMSGHTKFLCL